ncbi:MAG: hypothetical protein JWO31_3548 [Phycisphaerales bacterium]|nr:hypothetical protein [Phycisphaerales bacterium]
MSIVPAAVLSASELSRLGNNFGPVRRRRSFAPRRPCRRPDVMTVRREAPVAVAAAPAAVLAR